MKTTEVNHHFPSFSLFLPAFSLVSIPLSRQVHRQQAGELRSEGAGIARL